MRSFPARRSTAREKAKRRVCAGEAAGRARCGGPFPPAPSPLAAVLSRPPLRREASPAMRRKGGRLQTRARGAVWRTFPASPFRRGKGKAKGGFSGKGDEKSPPRRARLAVSPRGGRLRAVISFCVDDSTVSRLSLPLLVVRTGYYAIAFVFLPLLLLSPPSPPTSLHLIKYCR